MTSSPLHPYPCCTVSVGFQARLKTIKPPQKWTPLALLWTILEQQKLIKFFQALPSGCRCSDPFLWLYRRELEILCNSKGNLDVSLLNLCFDSCLFYMYCRSIKLKCWIGKEDGKHEMTASEGWRVKRKPWLRRVIWCRYYIVIGLVILCTKHLTVS